MAETDEGGRAAGDTGPSRGGGAGAGSGNVFMRKLGPAPVWLWMLAVLGLVLVFVSLRKNKAAGAAAATTATSVTPDATQTPPFIIQNYPAGGGGGRRQTGSTGSINPPPSSPAAPASWGYTVTGTGDTNISTLIHTVYGVPYTDTTEYAILANQITSLNPNRSTWGSSIPKGTIVNLPGSGPPTTPTK